MGRGGPKTSVEKAKKPKTEIQRKREERKTKKALPKPRPAPIPSTIPKLPKGPKIVKPKPKPQNPAFTKWTAYFKRAITTQETTLKVLNRVQDHMRTLMDKMEGEERSKFENGETSNWPKLQFLIFESKAALLRVREASEWILPPKKLGLYKNGLGMKGFVVGESTAQKARAEGGADSSPDEDTDMMDTDEEMTDADLAPADFVPLNTGKKALKPSKSYVDKEGGKIATDSVEPSPFFVVDTNPTPVNLSDTSKKGKKRAQEDDVHERKAAKKTKNKKAVVAAPEHQTNPINQAETEPRSKAKSPDIDFSAIEAQLQAEIEAGQKAKDEREAAKLAKKKKKRKRLSEGDSEKDVKRAKKEKETVKNKRKVVEMRK